MTIDNVIPFNTLADDGDAPCDIEPAVDVLRIAQCPHCESKAFLIEVFPHDTIKSVRCYRCGAIAMEEGEDAPVD